MSAETEPHAKVRRPGRWVLQRVEHSAWFTTRVTWALPDGTSARWSSRLARRRGRVELHDAAGVVTGVVDAEPVTARRLVRINAVAAVSFVLGGSLFALGALLAQLGDTSTRTVDVTYLVGGVFFSLGGYASVLQAVNTPTDIDDHGSLSSSRWRWWKYEPDRIGWLSAAVLFVGTLFFAVSLVAAFAEHLTPRQTNGWIWLPDITGCVCFLVSGHLALLEVSNGRFAQRLTRPRLVDRRGQPVRLGAVLPGRARSVRPAGDLRGVERRDRQLGDLHRCPVLRRGRGDAALRATHRRMNTRSGCSTGGLRGA